ncbi:MAG: hypothetical protein R3F43_02990 [bacterium]
MSEPRASRAAVGFALEVPALLLAMQGGPGRVLGIVIAIGAILAARQRPRSPRPARRPGPAPPRRGRNPLWLRTLFSQGAPASGPCGRSASWASPCPASPSPPHPAQPHPRPRLRRARADGPGQGHRRVEFGIATAACTAALLLALTTADRGSPPLLRFRRGALLPLVAALGFAGLVMAGLGMGLPAAEPAVSGSPQPALQQDQARSGLRRRRHHPRPRPRDRHLRHRGHAGARPPRPPARPGLRRLLPRPLAASHRAHGGPAHGGRRGRDAPGRPGRPP